MGFSVNFYLDSAISKKKLKNANTLETKLLKTIIDNEVRQIFVYLRFTGSTVKVFVERKCTQKQWDADKQKVNSLYFKAGPTELNGYLNDVHDEVSKLHEGNLKKGIITESEDIKKIISKLNNRNHLDVGKHKDFFEYIDDWILKVKRAPATITVYNTTVKHLKGFASTKKRKLDFNRFNLDFYHDFTSYLMTDLSMSENSTGKYIKTLKTFLNEATEEGFNSDLSYKSKKFKVFNSETDAIYLDEKELLKIYKHDLKDNKKLDEVRDSFIIEAYSGLRYSDLSKVSIEKIISTDKGDILKIKMLKTNEIASFPLHWTLKELLKKYDNKLPKILSNGEMNAMLKTLGKEVKLNNKITITENISGKNIEKTYEKFELLTTHSGRRSFCTNAFLKGIPMISIMKMSGHKTEKAFLKYIRMSSLDNAMNLISHSFFTGK